MWSCYIFLYPFALILAEDIFLPFIFESNDIAIFLAT